MQVVGADKELLIIWYGVAHFLPGMPALVPYSVVFVPASCLNGGGFAHPRIRRNNAT